jgi:type II secretory pathway pseudopilin PulG
LVELVVAMAIVAILATAAVLVNVTRNLARARDNKRQADLEGLRSTLERYRYDIGTYVTLPGGNVSGLTALTTGNYVATLPTDPSTGYNYYYSSIAPSTSYTLCARLEIAPASLACTGVSCGGANCNYQVANP